MESNKRICELLVQTGAFKDLDEPVILTSGELGIYYVNTEKLLQDNGEFEKYGDDALRMASHACSCYQNAGHRPFQDVIDILAEKVKVLFGDSEHNAVSGGQRRDWLFSCPVAELLSVPHIALYKQKDGQEDHISINDGIESYKASDLSHFKIVHVVDLITEGSSVYRTENGAEKGWVPMIKSVDGNVNDLFAVVSRKQGGEEALAKQGVNVHSLVTIDEDFLKNHSKYPERDIAYFANPKFWSEKFLHDNEVTCLVKFFNPDGGKLDRAKKFIGRYGEYIKGIGAYEELDKKVQEAYGRKLDMIMGAK
jgi:orotate phosphoribosyltransferase